MASDPGTAPNERRGVAKWLRRGLALVLGLVLTEVALRATGYVWLEFSGRRVEVAEGASPRILCVGDSNTYGVGFDAAEAYPGQLEMLLHAAGVPAAVFNLGIPGRDTGTLLRELPRWLETYRPDVVLVTVGVNNAWAWKAPVEGEERPWWESWRLAKTARLIAHRVQGVDDAGAALPGSAAERAVFEGMGNTRTPKEELPPLPRTIRTDMALILALVRSAGAEPVVMGYGANTFTYRRANDALRASDAELGFGLVEHWPAMDALIRRVGERSCLLADGHPTALGYGMIARGAFNALVQRGFVDAESLDLLAGVSPPAREGAQVRLIEEPPGRTALELQGEMPGAPFFVLLSGDEGSGEVVFDGQALPLVDDPLARHSLAGLPFRGHFDTEGKARVELGDVLRFVDGNSLRVLYVLTEGVDDWPYPWTSSVHVVRASPR